MSLKDHAEYELRRAGMLDPDSDYRGELGKGVLELIKLFASQGHSGYSAKHAVALFSVLANFEPLTPLTGEDDEWIDRTGEYGGDVQIWQNRRCPNVFKDEHGAYDIDKAGERGERSIVFPYTP